MIEYIFLFVLAGVYLLVASIQDIKKNEVENWISFSLILFGLVYRLFFSVYFSDLRFFILGLISFGIFFILGYALYYARAFAGGDAKLFMSLGVIFPLNFNLIDNIFLFLGFIFFIFLAGSLWTLAFIIPGVFKKRKEFGVEFKRQIKLHKMFFYFSVVFALLIFVMSFFLDSILIYAGFLLLLMPIMFVFGKSVEEACMIREIEARKATVGDWLYEDVNINGKIIKQNWQGLDEKDVLLLRKSGKKIKVKYGAPFVPGMFLGFLIFIYVFISGFDFLILLK